MKRLAILAILVLGGCGSMDVHGPKTVVAPAEGGSVTVTHGNRLRLPLATDPNGGYEWHRTEPQILAIVAEGPADASGINFTPVRSGEEKLRLEYRPLGGGAAERTVDYGVKVSD
jgi:predicted secreted protein